MNIQIAHFKSEDKINLTGIIYRNEKETDKILISVHGMVSNCLKRRDEEIANKIGNIGIDLLAFNNRGHDIANYTKKPNGEKVISGTAFEDAEDGYYDIVGAIKYALEKGYKEIVIWCLKENIQARGFYEKIGGKLYKERYIEIGQKEYKEISYIYELK